MPSCFLRRMASFLEVIMRLPLSTRLQVCCGFIAPGDVVADIGCDHGYLGIYLLKNNIAARVYASDIHQGPLDSAFHNAHKFSVADKMSFYLSDGLKNVPRDFTVAVCAGMGADTIQSVLEAAPWLRNEKYRLILQCQSRRPQLRRYLSENGWRITEESVIQDGRFLYTVMEVYWEPAYPKLTPGEWFFPPAIMENPSKYTAAYYDDAVFRLNRELAGKKDTADPTLQAALTELENMKEIVDDIRS